MGRRTDAFADITYRANVIDGREVVVCLRRPPEAATLADAWARLAALDPGVDPRSIEIEIRAPGPSKGKPRGNVTLLCPERPEVR
jgi:hypothetical protein